MTDVPLLDTLEGHVALVTGASRGLGAAIARGLADLGATVYAGVRNPDDAEPLEGARVVRLDVTDDAAIRTAVARIRDEAGRLDVLVNNAGAPPAFERDLLEESVESIDRTLNVDVRGSLVVTKEALPLILERPGGRVVNVASAMGVLTRPMGGETAGLAARGSTEAAAYRVAKTALNAFTRYLHAEYHDARGLVANSFTPGWVASRMGGKGARTPEEGAATGVWLARFAPDAPSGGMWKDRAPFPW